MGNGRDSGELPRGEFDLYLSCTTALNNHVKLVTDDEKRTVVAEFHRAYHLLKKQKARLEVQPVGMEMLDYIVLTFVFAENKRRERETRARAASPSY